MCLSAEVLFAGQRANPGARYERIICVVPMTGAGTVQDPKRPMFTAPPAQSLAAENTDAATSRSEANRKILAFQSVLSDDGQSAIVMFVARSRQAFRTILSDPNTIRHFEPDKIAEKDLVQELRKYKRNFDLKMLRVRAL